MHKSCSCQKHAVFFFFFFEVETSVVQFPPVPLIWFSVNSQDVPAKCSLPTEH